MQQQKHRNSRGDLDRSAEDFHSQSNHINQGPNLNHLNNNGNNMMGAPPPHMCGPPPGHPHHGMPGHPGQGPPGGPPPPQQQIQCKKNLQKMMGISPSDIDKYSRIFFPVTFICFNLMYWIIYLHVSDEIAEELVMLND